MRIGDLRGATLGREDQLLDLDQAAARLSVSKVTVKRMVSSGELASVRLHDRRLIRESDLSIFIAKLEG